MVTGIAASWDSCTSVRTLESLDLIWPPYASCGATESLDVVWSPCGQFIAVKYWNRIEVQDPNTLERLSVLNPPSNQLKGSLRSFDFSPNGHLVAGFYHG